MEARILTLEGQFWIPGYRFNAKVLAFTSQKFTSSL
jgi:hypothetical protein